MWTAVLVLIIVMTLASLAWWVDPTPRRLRHSRGGGGVQPGLDYNNGY